MTERAARLAHLTPQQREAVLARVRARAAAEATAKPKDEPSPAGPTALQPIARDGPTPCSFAQARLWLQTRLAPESPFYTIHAGFDVDGPLNLTALQQAIDLLVQRHEGLRTLFFEQDGQPYQSVVPADRARVTVATATFVAEAQAGADAAKKAEAAAQAFGADAGAKPFDLSRDLPMRVSVARLSADRHLLFLTLHHIIADGWSLSVLLSELGATYASLSGGGGISALPPLPVQYSDYATWQRARVSGDRLDRQLQYWKDQLSGAPDQLALPLDRARPAHPSFRGDAIRFDLEADLSTRIQALADARMSSRFAVLMAAWLTVLARYTGQSDLVVAAPLANRITPEIERVIGFFVNTVALRVSVADAPTFATLVDRVQAANLQAQDHQDVPFEQVVDAVRPDRDARIHPLVQTVFAYQNASRETLTLSDLSVRPIAAHTDSTRFDLELHLWQVGDTHAGFLFFATDLFDRVTAERLVQHFRAALEAGLVAPTTPVDALPLLSSAERHTLLADWGANPQPYPRDSSVPAQFARQVTSAADRVAVEQGAVALTYADLNTRAVTLARALQSQGNTAPVLVCLERSPAAIVAFLATLMAGRAYVPVDPTWPIERISLLAQRSGSTSIIIASGYDITIDLPFLSLSPDGYLARSNPAHAAGDDGQEDLPIPSAEDTAYILFTSGSTGEPKGVAVPHRAILRLVCNPDFVHLGPDVTMLHAAPATFDAATLEIWGPLLSGGRLVLAPSGPLSLRDLSQTVRDYGVSTLWLTAGLFHLLVDEVPEALSTVREVLAGGDVLSPDRVRRALKFVNGGAGRIINGYGPTENTTFSTCYGISAENPPHHTVPIGRPIANSTVRVVDDTGRLLPPGAVGELWVGGDGLAIGYVGASDRSAAAFVADPEAPTERLYRTGDLVRWRNDATLQFVGRRDTQVKIRGFRVELGEVEQALAAHPGVRDALVAVDGTTAEDRSLVAFIVPTSDSPQSQADAEAREGFLATWQTLYEQTYRAGDGAGDDVNAETLDFTGWNSSYTGKAIPEPEMRAWRDATLDRLRPLIGNRVMEVGCGTGLLLSDLAPRCVTYVATDYARPAVARIATLCRRDPRFAHVEPQHRRAEDWDGVRDSAFDTVILNSICQYFPDQAYLSRVIEGALLALAPGGTLFLGDLRSLPLLSAFAASVQLDRAAPDTPIEAWRRATAHAIDLTEELLIDPAYLVGLTQHPDIAAVEVFAKRGTVRNELTAYRYDAVILKVGGATTTTTPVVWHPWVPAEGLGSLAQRLAETDDAVGITDVPNPRLDADRWLVEWLVEDSPAATVAGLRAALAAHDASGPALETFYALAKQHNRQLIVRWSDHTPEAGYDLVFGRAGANPLQPGTIDWPSAPVDADRPLTNRPLEDLHHQRLVETVSSALAQRLPAFMRPERIIVTPSIPLTANGKPDRTRLLASIRRHSAQDVDTPRAGTETAVARIWSGALKTEAIGRHDDFFRLGGHSLLATRIAARIRADLGVDVPLADIFAHPTVASLAARIDTLPSEGEGQTDAIPTITPDPATAHVPFPLTDIQHAYWVGRGDDIEQGGVASYVYLEIDVDGIPLDRLEAGWNRLIQRHPMLRAVVDPDGSQRVLPSVPPYRIAREDGTEVRLAAMRAELSHQRLDSTQWPLFTLNAATLGLDRYRLFFGLDALIADAWSLSLLFQEWQRLVGDPDTVLPALSLTFRDYALAETGLRTEAGYERARSYWLDRVKTMPAAPQLPRTTGPEASVTAEFTGWGGTLSADQWTGLKRTAQRCGLTPSVALMTAFADVLGHWSASPLFTLNLTLFQRLPLHPEVNQIVGDFTSLTLLEVDSQSASTFVARAKTLQKRLASDLDHRAFSGIEVMRALAKQQGDGLSARMPVVFTSTLPLAAEGGGTADRPLIPFGELAYSLTQTPQVWLDAGVREEAGVLLFGWNARAGLFPEGMLSSMFAAYGALLGRLASDEAAWTEVSEALTPAAEIALAARINATDTPVSDATLHGLVCHQAARTPDAIAVIDADRSIPYRTLVAQAGRLATTLAGQGVGAGEPVAVCLERGWAQVAATLGITAAGAAYVPIDPSLPPARRSHLIQHAGCRLVVTDAALSDRLDWPPSVTRLDLPAIVDDPAIPIAPPASTDPDQRAYIIYTSGSTGQPKGVAISHRGAVNTILDVNRRFGFTAADRVLALSALSFDLSVHDIFGTLAAGAAVVTVPPDQARDPAAWADLVARAGVTVWNTVPALMDLMVDQIDRRRAAGHPVPGRLRLVLLSGDWIPIGLPDRLRAVWPTAQVISLGGATEASIWSIFHPIDRVDPGWTSIPYGKPLANQRLHVLGPDLAPRPVWVPGALFIGGVGLALEYWHDPVRTAESFITHPQTGERLYKTGDLGRRLPDGTIEFLGRQDFQVKINGHRIELGEIEAALTDHPGVIRAAVTATVMGPPGTAASRTGQAAGPPAGPRRLVGHVTVAEAAAGAPVQRLSRDPDQTAAWWAAAMAAGRAAEATMPDDTRLRIAELRAAMERLATAAIVRTLAQLNAFADRGRRHTADSLVSSARLDPHFTKLIGQWLAVLAEDGMLRRERDSFTALAPWPDPADADEAVAAHANALATAMAVDPDSLPALEYFLRTLDAHHDLLTGATDALTLLFPDGQTDRARSLYQLNPLADYQNRIAAEVLAATITARLDADPTATLHILEVGAGTGATTASLLPAIDRVLATLPVERQQTAIQYTYTDLSPFFFDQARDRFGPVPYLQTALLDIDREPTHQGFQNATVDILIASGVLHNLHDVGVGLRGLRQLLTPGGQALVLEGTHNSRLNMATVAFLEGFSNYADERLETNLPLLSANGWCRALQRSGFVEVSALPTDPNAGLHVIVGQAPNTVAGFQPDRLRSHMADRLPEPMVPSMVLAWPTLPLTGNGKLDRAALEAAAAAALDVSANAKSMAPPRTATERTIHAAWVRVLGHSAFGVTDVFFAVGGDSLLAMRAIADINTATGADLSIRAILEHGTVSALAERIDSMVSDAGRSHHGDVTDPDRADGDGAYEEGVL